MQSSAKRHADECPFLGLCGKCGVAVPRDFGHHSCAIVLTDKCPAMGGGGMCLEFGSDCGVSREKLIAWHTHCAKNKQGNPEDRGTFHWALPEGKTVILGSWQNKGTRGNQQFLSIPGTEGEEKIPQVVLTCGKTHGRLLRVLSKVDGCEVRLHRWSKLLETDPLIDIELQHDDVVLIGRRCKLVFQDWSSQEETKVKSKIDKAAYARAVIDSEAVRRMALLGLVAKDSSQFRERITAIGKRAEVIAEKNSAATAKVFAFLVEAKVISFMKDFEREWLAVMCIAIANCSLRAEYGGVDRTTLLGFAASFGVPWLAYDLLEECGAKKALFTLFDNSKDEIGKAAVKWKTTNLVLRSELVTRESKEGKIELMRSTFLPEWTSMSESSHGTLTLVPHGCELKVSDNPKTKKMTRLNNGSALKENACLLLYSGDEIAVAAK